MRPNVELKKNTKRHKLRRPWWWRFPLCAFIIVWVLLFTLVYCCIVVRPVVRSSSRVTSFIIGLKTFGELLCDSLNQLFRLRCVCVRYSSVDCSLSVCVCVCVTRSEHPCYSWLQHHLLNNPIRLAEKHICIGVCPKSSEKHNNTRCTDSTRMLHFK